MVSQFDYHAVNDDTNVNESNLNDGKTVIVKLCGCGLFSGRCPYGMEPRAQTISSEKGKNNGISLCLAKQTLERK